MLTVFLESVTVLYQISK